MSLQGRTLVITGASRGIGLAIAVRAARDHANVAILAKTVEEHPKLPGTIHTASVEIEKAGGTPLAIQCDIRFEDQVADAIKQTAERFGGIDILINNASAISMTPTAKTDMKRFDLMHQVNARGTFMCSQLALPYLKKASNPHILTLSPPINLKPHWFKDYCAYTMAKYGMSLCTIGMAAEFKSLGIAVNSLWPETAIDTAAVRNLNLLGTEGGARGCRKPEIVADAAHWILSQPATECTGNFFIDSDVLRAAGRSDLTEYAVNPDEELQTDFFLDRDDQVQKLAAH